ncbi:16769_t:CDS:2, partial [Gigaspora margarita]
DSICNIYRYAMSLKLVWPYIVKENNLSVEEYLTWAQSQTIISQSGFLDQYQGLNTILEEINKFLKSLILFISLQHH